jgi:fructose-1,6-bisphosphatase/inositol monophosphatase family enzyme
VAKGELMLGIIHHPLAGELYSARRDGGAFLNGQPINRVDHPDRRRIGIACASLLAEKAVVWE